MDPSIIGELVIYMVVLIFAISAHEAAHAWMSYKFGDDTAYLLGRVTLNPAMHTDPVGTLLIPIANFLISAMGGGQFGMFLIGWGKPTPVNPLRWRNKNVANVMVSIAGILANTLIATAFIILFKIFFQHTSLFESGGALEGFRAPVLLFVSRSIFMNASLAVFNLLPFPPLDGSKILETFLPESFQSFLRVLEQYGFLILILAIYLGVFRAVFLPVQALIFFILSL
jgi:Zn-dependent protease